MQTTFTIIDEEVFNATVDGEKDKHYRISAVVRHGAIEITGGFLEGSDSNMSGRMFISCKSMNDVIRGLPRLHLAFRMMGTRIANEALAIHALVWGNLPEKSNGN